VPATPASANETGDGTSTATVSTGRASAMSVSPSYNPTPPSARCTASGRSSGGGCRSVTSAGFPTWRAIIPHV
jgi:hypothetical protein